MRVLADDHPGILEVVQRLLKTHVDVLESVDNVNLYSRLPLERPDVIVTDISMPKLNGIEAVRRLEEADCLSKIVFLSVHSDHDFIDAALQMGALGYVLKTSLAAELLFAVQEAIAGRVFFSSRKAREQNSHVSSFREHS
jgi:DNA-binding NarL/FixJ family response regulator